MTKNRKTRKRLWALLLSAVMIVTQLPAVAMAENATPEDGSIASFEPLPSGVANQTVDVGTELSGLNLPDTVTATVYHVTEDTIIPDEDTTEDDSDDPSTATPSDAGESISGNHAGDSSAKDSGETVMIVTTSTEEIPVTWDSEPAYNGSTEGKYVFTADVGGYALSSGANLPQITVTVSADTAANPTENPPTEPLSCTKTEGCTLAEGHEGECKTKTAVITVTAFDGLDEAVKYQTVEPGTKLDGLTLPATLGASGYTVTDDTEPAPEPITINGVTWEPTGKDNSPTEYGEERSTPCIYYFQPVLPEGYGLAEAAVLPEIEVCCILYSMAGRANTSNYYEGDVNAFKAILDMHPSLKSSPDLSEDDPSSWETAGLVAWDSSSQRRIIKLSLYDKGLTGVLDVKDLTALKSLACGKNLLSMLYMGNLTALTSLSCSNNQLEELDVGNLTALTSLYCSNNRLSMLDVGKLTALTSLSCSDNQLSTLDVGNLTALTILSCYSNLLEELDVGNLRALTSLSCFNNLLEELDVGNLTALTLLACNNNRLSTLDMRNLTALTSLSCKNNPFTSFTATDGHTLTITPSIGGEIWLTQFNKDSNQVLLAAKPDTGYAFDTWNGLPAGTSLTKNIADFTLSRDETVAAVFRPLRTDATLKILSLSAGTLSPSFDPAVTSYTAAVDSRVSNIGITAIANDSGAAMTGYGAYALNVGSNTFTLTVTAEDGSTQKIYTVTITREKAPPATIPVTGVTLDKSAHTLYTNKDPRSFQLAAKVEPANASNKAVSWQSSDSNIVNVDGSGNVTAIKEGAATITVTTTDGGKTAACTVTVETDTSGNGGGGSDRSDENDRKYIITTPEPPNPVLAVIELPVTVGNGTATGKPDDGRTALAIGEAKRKAKTNGIAVQYDAKTALAYDGFSITIRRATLDRLIENKVKFVTLNTGIADLTLDLAALEEIQKQSAGDITLTATPETGLAGDALAAVGSRPAYRLSVNYTGKDGKAATVQNFGAGRVTVGLAYKPAADEQSGRLFLVYSADGKSAEWLYQSSYDKDSGNVAASTGHFSVYGVGYKPAPAFADTVNHWAKADIDFVASRDLLAGTGDATFTPDGTTTRGMFVVALGRLAGIDPAAYPSSRFTDVAATAYYAPYVEWAASKGIVTGTGEKTFSPDATITREQMAAIMQRYADKLGYTLPAAREAELFADEGQITSGMKNAVQAMQQAGVMNGKGGHRFGPKDTATRAEAAAVLRRFVEIVIDPAAAGGWGQNDAGK